LRLVDCSLGFLSTVTSKIAQINDMRIMSVEEALTPMLDKLLTFACFVKALLVSSCGRSVLEAAYEGYRLFLPCVHIAVRRINQSIAIVTDGQFH
jgi:hypothetical protein